MIEQVETFAGGAVQGEFSVPLQGKTGTSCYGVSRERALILIRNLHETSPYTEMERRNRGQRGSS